MTFLRAYLEFSKKSFLRNFVYRSEVWIQIVGTIVNLFIQVSIWTVLIGEGIEEGLSLADMVTYAIINSTLSLLLMTNIFKKVDTELRSGNIATTMIKPINYPLQLFFDQLGNMLFQAAFTLIPSILIAIIVFGLYAPHPDHILPFIIAVFLAIIISFLIGYLIGLTAFWLISTFALEWAFVALTTVFSGSFLPIWFFSNEWATIAGVLPFQFLGFVPAAIYMGRIENMFETIATGLVWALALFVLNWFIWRKAMKRLFVQGG